MSTLAAIFDVDGTLVDSNDAHARAWVAAFASEGITVAFDAIRRSIGMGGDKLMPAVAAVESDSTLGRRINARRAHEFRQHQLPQVRPFTGVRALAERLIADGYVLAVASSANDDELRPLLDLAGVSDLIAERASASQADHSKPDPDIVTAAVDLVDSTPRDALMLGDTPYDVEAATRAGVRIVALECGGWSAESLRGALAIYANPANLLAHYETSPFAR